jgi:hypothetical protein
MARSLSPEAVAGIVGQAVSPVAKMTTGTLLEATATISPA